MPEKPIKIEVRRRKVERGICDICGAIFNTHAELNTHIQQDEALRAKKASAWEVILYYCAYCGMTFIDKTSLTAHSNEFDYLHTQQDVIVKLTNEGRKSEIPAFWLNPPSSPGFLDIVFDGDMVYLDKVYKGTTPKKVFCGPNEPHHLWVLPAWGGIRFEEEALIVNEGETKKIIPHGHEIFSMSNPQWVDSKQRVELSLHNISNCMYNGKLRWTYSVNAGIGANREAEYTRLFYKTPTEDFTDSFFVDEGLIRDDRRLICSQLSILDEKSHFEQLLPIIEKPSLFRVPRPNLMIFSTPWFVGYPMKIGEDFTVACKVHNTGDKESEGGDLYVVFDKQILNTIRIPPISPTESTNFMESRVDCTVPKDTKLGEHIVKLCTKEDGHPDIIHCSESVDVFIYTETTKQGVLAELAKRGTIPLKNIPYEFPVGGGWHRTGPCELEYIRMYEGTNFVMSIFADTTNPPTHPHDVGWSYGKERCETTCYDEKMTIEGEDVCKHCKATTVASYIMMALDELYAITLPTQKACLVYIEPHTNILAQEKSTINIVVNVSNCGSNRAMVRARLVAGVWYEDKKIEADIEPEERIELTESLIVPSYDIDVFFYAEHWDTYRGRWIIDEMRKVRLVHGPPIETPKVITFITTPINLYFENGIDGDSPVTIELEPNMHIECYACAPPDYDECLVITIRTDEDKNICTSDLKPIPSGKHTLKLPVIRIFGDFTGTYEVNNIQKFFSINLTKYPEQLPSTVGGAVIVEQSLIPKESYLTKPSIFAMQVENTGEEVVTYKVALIFTGINVAKEYAFASEWSETVKSGETTKINVEVTLPEDAIPPDKDEVIYDISTTLEALH